jgi:hypothetical protein
MIAIIALAVSGASLIVAVLAYRRDRHQVVVTLQGSTFAVPAGLGMKNWGLASITVASIGRAISVRSIHLEWVDPTLRPDSFGFGPLSRLDLGFSADAELPDGVAHLHLDEAMPQFSPRHLEAGQAAIFQYKVYSHDDSWAADSDRVPWGGGRAEMVAKVELADGKSKTSRPAYVTVTPLSS